MNALTALLGTRLPLIQAPMAGSQLSALAIACSEAGALGSLPAAMLSIDALRTELDALRAGTSHPFNVNFFCHTPPVPDEARERRWREALAPYYAAFGIDPASVSAGVGRMPFSHEAAEVLAIQPPRVVSFHFGLPDPALLQRVKSWGSVVLSSATTLEEARWLEAHGVDAVIAQGVEAGGHRGMFLSDDVVAQPLLNELLPACKAVLRVPVIAAGGIGTARDVAAAMALGADGVQVGTSFLLCPEAATTPVHRRALASAQGEMQSGTTVDTALTNLFTGRPARGLRNRLMREQGPLSPLALAFPLATTAIAPLRAAAEREGSGDFSPLWCGTSLAGMAAIPAREMVARLAEGFAGDR